MGYENKSGLGVHNFYGARDTGKSIGLETSNDSKHRLVITLDADMINGGFVPPTMVPQGASFVSALLIVDEAFVVTGTTPTVNVGAAGSAATNGITLTEAELETVGTKKPASTGSGTWAFGSATSAAAKIGFALGGTTPAVAAGSGKARLVLEYVKA